ncbi:sel1 repeat family protein [Paucibacter sp. B2R-40]|uniref:tetratricopeptide repeat protein n=1 Tax=Paucibacter sp. B2R-40 TaxID=2893554 RepID=UPI0021E4F591|nr:tetratricopeptide repeat protein [Paucibacter sp. B2R-40]MCV2356824.1 sel1 repeat family protein [Paucibacter sp. B2R-40]
MSIRPQPSFAAALMLAALVGSPHAQTAATPLEIAVEAYESGDLKTAARGFTALSAQREPLGDYNLAMMHLRAELPKPNPREAKRLLERAAAKGLVRAELALGQLYEQGVLGKPELAKSTVWYARAAEHGSVDAQVALATAYYLGRGAALDMKQAAHWFREAANAGDVGAQYLLASMYETGLGLPADLRLARYWYDIAARNGDEAAPSKLIELDRRLALEPTT